MPEINNALFQVIKGELRHPNYDRTVALAELYEQLITGEGIEGLMKQFNPREDATAFEQRKRITQQITPSVNNSLMSPAYKVPRSSSMSKALVFTNDKGTTEKDSAKETNLKNALNKFYGRKSFDDFCSSVFIDRNYIDPNSFIVLEFKPFDNTQETAKPYPFLVSSKEAVYYEYDEGILQFLVVLQMKGKLSRYTIYDKTGAQVCQEMDLGGKWNAKDQIYIYKSGNTSIDQKADEIFVLNEINMIVIEGKSYALITPTPYNLSEVPAFKVGFRPQKNRPDVFESPITPAIPYQMKSIKAVSEMDLTMALHCFPQKFQYGPPCNNEGCNNGKMPDGVTCNVCSGTGVQVHTTAQDSITLRLPKNPEEVFALSQMIHQEYPPIDGIKWQDEYIKSLTASCKEAIWNTDLFSRDEITQTATSKNIEMQSVYDVLYPFALHYSDFWEWGIRMIGEIISVKVIPTMHFGKDFKFMTKSDYIELLKAAKEAGASNMIISNIEQEIIKIDFEDNPELWTKYLTQEYFKPFPDKSPQSIIAYTATKPDDNKSILYWNFDEIFKKLELKNLEFYKMERTKQVEMVNEEIGSYKTVKAPETNE